MINRPWDCPECTKAHHVPNFSWLEDIGILIVFALKDVGIYWYMIGNDRNQIAVGVLCVGIEFPCLILAPADAVLG